MKEEQLNRINELAYKKKTCGLNESEQNEQKELYQLFISDIKHQIRAQLGNRNH